MPVCFAGGAAGGGAGPAIEAADAAPAGAFQHSRNFLEYSMSEDDPLDSFRCDVCKRLADLTPIAPNLYLCDYCAGLPLFVQLSFESQGSCDLVTEELPPEIVWISAEVSQANVHQYVIDTLSSTHYHGEETIVARLASFIVHDNRGPIDGVLYDTGNLPAGKSSPAANDQCSKPD